MIATGIRIAVVDVDAAVRSRETRTTIADEIRHQIRARSVVQTRRREALVDLVIASIAFVTVRTLALEPGRSVLARGAVLTRVRRAANDWRIAVHSLEVVCARTRIARLRHRASAAILARLRTAIVDATLTYDAGVADGTIAQVRTVVATLASVQTDRALHRLDIAVKSEIARRANA